MNDRRRDILIENRDEVKKLISRIPWGVWDALPRAVDAMMIPFVREMKRNLLGVKRTGLLRKSIEKKVTFYDNNNVAYGVVGPSVDVSGQLHGKAVRPFKYAHLVEYGTKPHHLRRKETGGYEAVAVRSGSGKRRTYFKNRKAYDYYGPIHPGAKPYPFRGPAQLAGQAESIRLGTIVVERAIEQAIKNKGKAA